MVIYRLNVYPAPLIHGQRIEPRVKLHALTSREMIRMKYHFLCYHVSINRFPLLPSIWVKGSPFPSDSGYPSVLASLLCLHLSLSWSYCITSIPTPICPSLFVLSLWFFTSLFNSVSCHLTLFLSPPPVFSLCVFLRLIYLSLPVSHISSSFSLLSRPPSLSLFIYSSLPLSLPRHAKPIL